MTATQTSPPAETIIRAHLAALHRRLDLRAHRLYIQADGEYPAGDAYDADVIALHNALVASDKECCDLLDRIGCAESALADLGGGMAPVTPGSGDVATMAGNEVAPARTHPPGAVARPFREVPT